MFDRKNISACLLGLCAAAVLMFPAAGHANASTLRVAAASDLHVQPPHQDIGLANPLALYNQEIVDALLWDAAQENMDVLVLCGDITNQGRAAQHEILTQKLRKAEKEGITILALPGNHDIGEVKPAQFAGLYDEFGYGDAYSRDEASLSYSVLMDNVFFLMLDTNGYTGSLHAFLTNETMEWAERQLMLAEEKGWQVIAAGHYPLLTEQSTQFDGKERMAALLKTYDVPLFLCGHMHGRNVRTQDGLTELVVDQTIAYPTCYALLEIEDGAIRYAPRRIDVAGWARETGEARREMLQYDLYQANLSRDRAQEIVKKLRGDKEMTPERYRQAEDFFCLLMDSRSLGTLHEYAQTLRAHPGYDAFLELADGTIYSRWVPNVLSNTTPYHLGFTIQDGEIMPSGE